MRPYISNTPFYRLTIPELSGGVNLRDGISLVGDNQLTDCKNVWYKDGMLRTRPGLNTTNKLLKKSDTEFNNGDVKVYADERNYRVIDGITYFLIGLHYGDRLDLFYCSDNKDDLFVGTIEIGVNYRHLLTSCNIFQHGNDIYCFFPGYYPILDETGNITGYEYFIYKISPNENDGWDVIRIGKGDAYAPTIAVNAHGYTKKAEATAGEILQGATLLEGLNLLGNRYKAYYSTVLPERLGNDGAEDINGEPAHFMSYQIPYAADDEMTKALVPTILKVTISYADKVVEHTAIHSYTDDDKNNGYFEDGVGVDGLKMYVVFHGNTTQIFFNAVSGFEEEPAKVTESNYIQNNMEIIAPCSNTEENVKKVLNMTCNEWYGGESEGLYGGIHLFLGGNTEEKEKSLVVWSDLNKPLYFSENAYAYVGDKAQRVTAFGRQGEALIIAKEKEMYATQYVSNTIDSEDVENQAVIDVAASEVTFPMTQVHGFIGCDCPRTMQLCRNRLVWANSDGKVYTLVSASQYNERSIYEVSDMVWRRLKEYSPETLRNAKAADWEGHYVLFIGNELYLMDYNSYGFSNVYSYTKSEDAQVKIPWWIWELPQDIPAKTAVSVAGKLFIPIIYSPIEEVTYKLVGMLWLEENGDSDNVDNVEYNADSSTFEASTLVKEIPTLLQTKFFDFGSPTIKKSIPKIEVSFGTNGGVPIKTTVLTESITDESEIVIDDPEEEEYSVGYFQNRLIRPANKHACRIGIRFESQGNMSVDAISLQYKLLGGLK